MKGDGFFRPFRRIICNDWSDESTIEHLYWSLPLHARARVRQYSLSPFLDATKKLGTIQVSRAIAFRGIQLVPQPRRAVDIFLPVQGRLCNGGELLRLL